jgi:hypothetical protein
MRGKGKLGAVRGRKYLDRIDRTKILSKGDTTSAWNYKFETTKFKTRINHSVSTTSYSVNNDCRPTTGMRLHLCLRIKSYPLRLSRNIKRTKSLTCLNWTMLKIIMYQSFIHIVIIGASLDRIKQVHSWLKKSLNPRAQTQWMGTGAQWRRSITHLHDVRQAYCFTNNTAFSVLVEYKSCSFLSLAKWWTNYGASYERGTAIS